MSSSAKPRIAVIGLGSMGYGMASALKRAGFEVTGCDVAAETVQRFVSEGGKGTKTPAEAAKDADTDLQALLISMGATKHQIFYKAVIPSAIPPIIATFRINIGFGLVGAVVGEFISSQRGLGHLIYTASSLYDLNTVWVGLFTLMIMGFILYYVIDLVERTTLPWKQSNTTHQVQV